MTTVVTMPSESFSQQVVSFPSLSDLSSQIFCTFFCSIFQKHQIFSESHFKQLVNYLISSNISLLLDLVLHGSYVITEWIWSLNNSKNRKNSYEIYEMPCHNLILTGSPRAHLTEFSVLFGITGSQLRCSRSNGIFFSRSI